MDFSQLPNPYDFANPINDPNLFVGRKREIEEIDYYLDHAGRIPRPINLALIGSRASGKTSMLNMIEVKAEERSFCTVRVNLDEGDAVTQLPFFYKIFDSILTQACSLGAYEGLAGKTYDVYCDIVSTYDVPEDKTFCPFTFPIRYAKAMSKGKTGIALPDTNFRRDVSAIQEELQRPIVILFDECDVLSQSRVHLQKLRNIFMNIPGFMLVMTGTPKLFPLINDVFSPIIRQFKKIDIGPFVDEDETADCIEKPLERIGIIHPAQIFDRETFFEVSEIHDLTGGRPYEIQLLCHFLFRRVQEGRAKRMKLTLDVLDDVLAELSTSQDVAARPILNAVRNLERDQLGALSKLCSCNGRATLEQIWVAEYIFWDERRWKKEVLEENLSELSSQGVLDISDGVIHFAGDDFDRIYCKYLARKHRVTLTINDMPFEVFLGIVCLHEYLTEIGLQDTLTSSAMFTGKIENIEMRNILSAMQSPRSTVVENPFRLRPDAAMEVYWSSIDARSESSFQAAIITISTKWTTVRQWFRCSKQKDRKECPLEDLPQMLADLSRRAASVGGSLEVEIYDLPVIPPDTLYKVVLRSNDHSLVQRLAIDHEERMIRAYLQRGDLEEACFHGDFAREYLGLPRTSNNLGYLYLVSKEIFKAKSLFEEALTNYKEDTSKALPTYNLGIVAAMQDDFQNAIAKFDTAKRQIQDADESERRCFRLIMPTIGKDGETIEYAEIKNPDLYKTIEQAITVIKNLSDKK